MKNKSYVIHVIIVFTFWQYFHPIVGVKIYPDVSELVIKKGNELTLNCTSDEPIQWSYPKGSKNSNKKTENETAYDTYYNILTINPAEYLDTGYFICQSKNNVSRIAQIYIYCFDEKNVLAVQSSVINVPMYDSAEIPCKPTSPNISVSLTRNGMEVESIEKFDPKIGYIISTYPMIHTAVFTCLAPKYGGKLRITVNVHPPISGSSNPHIEVTDSDFDYPIFETKNAELNCSIITSINTGIKYLGWEFPKNVEEKIFIENRTEIRHKEFIIFFQILHIYNVTKKYEGNYTCKAIDDDSNTKLSIHSLHIEELDSVFLNVSASEKSDMVTVKAGEGPAEFIATIKAFPKHMNTWYNPKGRKINGLSSNEKYDVMEDGFKYKLKINIVEVDDFGIYILKVKNSWITKTLNFTLIVEDKPGSIDMKKASGLFRSNTTYFPECTVTGYPLPQITWSTMNCDDYPNCENNNFQYTSIFQHEEEAVEAYQMKSTLHFKPNRSMIIRCEANNTLGSINASSPFLLTDYGSGVVMKKNSSDPITSGDNIELLCAASKYRYFNNFTWLLEKSKIIPSQEIQIKHFATNFSYVSTLSITNIQKNHGGKYTCQTPFNNISLKTRFAFGNSSHLTLTIKDAKIPHILRSNMNSGTLQIFPGKTVNIVIQVDGSPPPLVVWYKDGKPLSTNDRITLKTVKYQNLTIANVSREDEGIYSFEAINKAGNVSDMLKLLMIQENTYYNYIFGFLIFILLLLAGIVIWFLINLLKEKKKLQKILQEYGLEVGKKIAVPTLDSNLDIEEQTFLIPYNKKYEFPKEKLEFGTVLGSGAFGIVRKAEAIGIIRKGVKTTVAVKVAKRNHDSLFIKALVSELKIMIYLGQHPNVVNLLGACTKDLIKDELAVIVEYCKYGNLREFLLKQRNNFVNQITEHDEIDFNLTAICYENIPLDGETGIRSISKSIFNEETPIGSDGYLISNDLYEPEWRSNYLPDYSNVTMIPIKTVDLICWSFQVASGMEYLASRKILHGDLAARNILLAEGNIAKICDFGLAKSMYQNEEYQSSKTVFPVKWMAIESIRDRVFSTQSDVWSFGVAMWEIFSLAISPYPGLEHVSSLYEKLVSGYRMEKPKFATNKIYNLMKSCWNFFPKLRPSFTELCEELACLLDDSTRSQYVNLRYNNTTATGIDLYDKDNYLQMSSSPSNCNSNGDQIHKYECPTPNPPNAIQNPAYLEMLEIPS